MSSSWLALQAMELIQRRPKILVHRDATRSTLLGNVARDVKGEGGLAIAGEDHGPGEPADFAGPETRLEAQQDHGPVPNRVSCMLDVLEHPPHVSGFKHLCREPVHRVPEFV